MTPENAQKDIYINIAVTREMLDTLLKRGKPASLADLQTLMASVEAKSRPNWTLPAKEVADALAPQLLPLVPTHATLVQAGEQSAVRMEAAIKAGTKDSVQQVMVAVPQLTAIVKQLVATMQHSASQTTASAAVWRSATASGPRSFLVSFPDDWKWSACVMAVTTVVVVLFSWGLGAWGGVDKARYKELLRVAQAIQDERDGYRDQVRTFRRDMSKSKGKSKDGLEMSKLAQQYFPLIGADTVARK